MCNVTLGPATFHFPLFPPTGRCKAELYLTEAGIPILCGGRGVVRMPNGQTVCKVHFEKLKNLIED